MIDMSIIYRNPTLESDYYYGKVIKIEEEDVDEARPRIHVRFKILPHEELSKKASNAELSLIIHATDGATSIYQAFCKMFGITDGNHKAALDRFASIAVQTAKRGETTYSAVYLVKQNRFAKANCAAMQKDEDDGLIHWGLYRQIH